MKFDVFNYKKLFIIVEDFYPFISNISLNILKQIVCFLLLKSIVVVNAKLFSNIVMFWYNRITIEAYKIRNY